MHPSRFRFRGPRSKEGGGEKPQVIVGSGKGSRYRGRRSLDRKETNQQLLTNHRGNGAGLDLKETWDSTQDSGDTRVPFASGEKFTEVR